MTLLKKVVVKLITRIPSAKNYLEEKKNLDIQNRSQTKEILKLRQQSEKLTQQNQILNEKIGIKRKQNGQVFWPLLEKEILHARPTKVVATKKMKAPFTINWVVPPLLEGSGGQADIIRTISFLESRGHTCRIYFFDPRLTTNLAQIKEVLKTFPRVDSQLFYNETNFLPSDMIFATDWISAYPVFAARQNTRKYYFVQDFEPFFVPQGSLSTLAEKTYSFGFRGVTLGKWLASKLSNEYSMKCDHFDFGYDPKEYYFVNDKKRSDVIFYARPRTARRGFELGIMALKIFHKRNPSIKIHMFGADLSNYVLPFPYANHGIAEPSTLNRLYNECAAGLVISLSNMSLVPIEMIAAGCVPVVNEADYTTAVEYKKEVVYCDPMPMAMADALERAVHEYSTTEMKVSATHIQRFTWEVANEQIEKILMGDAL